MGCGASSVQNVSSENEKCIELDLKPELDVNGGEAVRKGTWELGVTLGFLSDFLSELDLGDFSGSEDFTTDEVVEKFIKPAVVERQVRYVDLIDSKFVKPPTVFVSHRWKGRFRNLVRRLLKEFKDEMDVSVWLDIFAVNQNQNEETKRDLDGFERVIQETRTTAFSLDDKGEALKRVWCLYEVWKTFSHRGVESLNVMTLGIGATALREIFYTVDVARAEAFKQSDVEWILADIQKEFDYVEFNLKVRDSLLKSTTKQVQRSNTVVGRVCDGSEEPTHQRLAHLHQNFLLLSTAGKFSEALPVAQKQLALSERIYGEEHSQVGLALNNLAEVYRNMGRYEDALPLYQQALAISEKLGGKEHHSTALALNNLAQLYRNMGRYSDALPLYKRALGIYQAVHGKEHSYVATCSNNLAGCHRNMGKYDEALPLYQEALAINQGLHGPRHPSVALSCNNMAELYRNMGSYADARPLYTRALSIYEKVHGPSHPHVATSLSNMAELYRNEGKYEECLPLYERALLIYEATHGNDHPLLAAAMINKANCLKHMGRLEEAQSLYQQGSLIYEKVHGPGHQSVAGALMGLGALWYDMGKYDEALPLYQRALVIYEKVNGTDHSSTMNTRNWLRVLEGKLSA
mmetsp:Transcript_29758/g.64988  ORF Transcript_29758/g.64988 Transcript_29758/m.64988 type:complete len:633 (-) Transcript_29758:189-2087(-)|eukprot:CAMPEP_0118935504 /NCGR_PEP_ID=MMETSP1169-20130426/15677_1 /TAXON_ID=36882 /ORGANISM="Pyramimonas obovata, Strain CCMP722" /LENGTH=632 /DNA_ID=CAMNT_0006878549 /DNA_START=103 /DNA_END=2001 /DNA_ORIENTATION=+